MAEETTNNTTVNGTVGPDAKYMKMISADEFEFAIPKDEAMKAGALASMMMRPGEFEENEENSINFQEIYSRTLKQVALYLSFKQKYSNSEKALPEFPIQVEISLDLLMVANFLDC